MLIRIAPAPYEKTFEEGGGGGAHQTVGQR